jgi:hypothetical protein
MNHGYRVSYPFRRLLLDILYRVDRQKNIRQMHKATQGEKNGGSKNSGLGQTIIANDNSPRMVMGHATITRAVTKCSHCIIITD